MKIQIALFACCGFAASAIAQPTINGSISGGGYGAPFAVQTVDTQFGDNFSELNAAYARVFGGRLYMAFTGNLENNFNKLNVFFDTGNGGQNTIIPAGNNTDNWRAKHVGMTFDSGFNPDRLLIFRRGAGQFDVDWSNVASFNPADGGQVGSAGSDSPVGVMLSNTINGQLVDMQVAYDGSNTAGIGGGTGPADQAAALAVTTGIEFSINLDALGLIAGQQFKVSVMVNGSNHDFLSNQFLGGLPAGTGNLGGDGAGGFIGNLSGINLNNFAGNQYFVVPAPASAALLGLGAVAAIRRRR